MKKTTKVLVFVGLFLSLVLPWNCLGATMESAEKIRVAFLNPDPKHPGFWQDVEGFMSAAAEDLGIELLIYHSPMDRFNYKRQLLTVLEEEKPDYLICIFKEGMDREYLGTVERAGVLSYIINTEPLSSEVGAPREKLKSWIGHRVPDDERAGYDLAQFLIKKAKHKGLFSLDGKIHMVAMSGSRDSSASLERLAGLKRAINEHPEVVLLQTIFTDWSKEDAKRKFMTLSRRHPKARVYWAVTDTMAQGVVEGAQEKGLTPGRNLIAGGMDWTDRALASIKAGHMEGSLGQHFMGGGIALIQLFDYHHGFDFTEEGVSQKYPLALIDGTNIGLYLKKYGNKDWSSIDFRRFSKKFNPRMKRYDFSLENFFKE